MHIWFDNGADVDRTGLLFVPVFEGGQIGEAVKTADFDMEAYDLQEGELPAYIRETGFSGKLGETEVVSASNGEGLVLLGVGNPEKLDKKGFATIAAAVERATGFLKAKEVTFAGDMVDGMDMSAEEFVARIADTLVERSYVYDENKTTPKKENDLDFCGLVTDDKQADKIYESLETVTQSVNWAKDLCNKPSNKLTPEIYAKQIQEKFKDIPNVKVKIIYPDEMGEDDLNMGGIMAVGKGSDRPPRVVVVEYDGTDGADAPILGLVGKGVTFDVGGNSMKPAASQRGMHLDMSGSAGVVAGIHALAARGAKSKVVGVVGLVENMVSGKAMNVGDVITMMNGNTVEVTNTDAEGRLVLADCLTYIQQKYDPDAVVDMATLTGAITYAVGTELTGIFSNDKEFAEILEEVGKTVGEEGWILPCMREEFAKTLKSEVADFKNATTSGPNAGASIAADFLSYFVDKGRTWVHLDIAATSKNGGMSTGRCVRTIDRLSRELYEPPVREVSEHEPVQYPQPEA